MDLDIDMNSPLIHAVDRSRVLLRCEYDYLRTLEYSPFILLTPFTISIPFIILSVSRSIDSYSMWHNIHLFHQQTTPPLSDCFKVLFPYAEFHIGANRNNQATKFSQPLWAQNPKLIPAYHLQ